MKPLTEQRRNVKRFNRLSQKEKDVVNMLALVEFAKPIHLRQKPVEILDLLEFYYYRKKPKN